MYSWYWLWFACLLLVFFTRPANGWGIRGWGSFSSHSFAGAHETPSARGRRVGAEIMWTGILVVAAWVLAKLLLK